MNETQYKEIGNERKEKKIKVMPERQQQPKGHWTRDVNGKMDCGSEESDLK